MDTTTIQKRTQMHKPNQDNKTCNVHANQTKTRQNEKNIIEMQHNIPHTSNHNANLIITNNVAQTEQNQTYVYKLNATNAHAKIKYNVSYEYDCNKRSLQTCVYKYIKTKSEMFACQILCFLFSFLVNFL